MLRAVNPLSSLQTTVIHPPNANEMKAMKFDI
jgi:hypothetical protein